MFLLLKNLARARTQLNIYRVANLKKSCVRVKCSKFRTLLCALGGQLRKSSKDWVGWVATIINLWE